MHLVIQDEPAPLHVDEQSIVRVGGTRLTLDSVLAAYKAGATAEEVSQSFLGLSLADVYAILTYYHRYQVEVEQYLADEQQAAEAAWREYQADQPQDDLVARLR